MSKIKTTQYDINRLIIGNQLHIMRSIASMENCPQWRRNTINDRVRSVKRWWIDRFDDEVGFEAGDEKTKSTEDIMAGK